MTRMMAVAFLVVMMMAMAFAQTAASPPAVVTPVATTSAAPSVMDVIKDPGNITAAAFIAANVADSQTDWKFVGPVSQKQYVITPAQRVGIAGGGVMAALALKYFAPKSSKWVDGVLGVATAYFAGRALANTYSHGNTTTGSPPSAAVPNAAVGSKLAFAVRLRVR